MNERAAADILDELAALSARRGALELELAAALRAAPPPRAEAPASGASEYLTTREAAAFLGVSERHLKSLRAEGRGPKYLRVGRSVRYCRSELAGGVSAGAVR